MPPAQSGGPLRRKARSWRQAAEWVGGDFGVVWWLFVGGSARWQVRVAAWFQSPVHFATSHSLSAPDPHHQFSEYLDNEWKHLVVHEVVGGWYLYRAAVFDEGTQALLPAFPPHSGDSRLGE